MPGFWNGVSQFYPGKPTFTERDVPDLRGKVSSISSRGQPGDTGPKSQREQVYIVTGSNTGIGKEVAQILYTKHARVYVAARSERKGRATIEAIKQAVPNSTGTLEFLHLDLADLTTIKPSAEEFLSKEKELHVLFNNAGVWCAPRGSKTVQDYELHLGVNNIGPFMFTKLLTPILLETAKGELPGTVRVVWTSSFGAEHGSYVPGGVQMDNLDYHDDKPPVFKYNVSKAGNYLHAVEFANRYKALGVNSISLNPGNLDTDLIRDVGPTTRFLLRHLFGHPPVYGAYTELFAGFSPEVPAQKTERWGK